MIRNSFLTVIELKVGHFISQFHVLFLSVALGSLATMPTTYLLLGESPFLFELEIALCCSQGLISWSTWTAASQSTRRRRKANWQRRAWSWWWTRSQTCSFWGVHAHTSAQPGAQSQRVPWADCAYLLHVLLPRRLLWTERSSRRLESCAQLD